MKRLLYISLFLVLFTFSLTASSPYSLSIGRVAVDIKEGTDESVIYSAMREEYTEDWLERYTSSPISFALSYSDDLSSLLPMKNFLLSTSVDGRVKVLEKESGTVITFVLKDGRISALDIE